ncbi:PREDICTED: gap junction delta-4 protein [Elephantulus edwardii]|uniref:gap junction delta-4 protein n=1 Tax=Elephantulus edwardii TaxID=28737 RepID=UPI0003F0967A|nr:PREDICTED: gap junction delta-4 protein [Elephantulus edwardii]
MGHLDLLGFLIITLNYNVTIVGKIWLIFMILLRMMVIVLAGYPIYQDEQDRFVCNTLQPGCSNVCYDIFSPVSHFRFWLIQSVSVLLPYAVFSVYVLHQGAMHVAAGCRGSDGGPLACGPSELTTMERHCPQPSKEEPNLDIPDFSSGYIAHLFLRILVEAAFGALHYLLFGFMVPKRFSCSHPPCTSVVDCYISRPTEKSIMMLFMWGVSALSFVLSLVDLMCSVQRRMWRRRVPRRVARSFSSRRECEGLKSTRGPSEDHLASQSLGRRPSHLSEDGRWEGEEIPAHAGGWPRGEGSRTHFSSPSEKSGVSRKRELTDEEESEVISSSASEKLTRAHQEPRSRLHREAAQDSRSEGHTSWGEVPAAPRSRLGGHYLSTELQAPERLVNSSSASHLRTNRSEWV